MFSYIALLLVLVGVVPVLCYFAGLMDLYLQFGAPFAGVIILLWLLVDVSKMRHSSRSCQNRQRHK
ncbi:hypothetical protein [Celerinatantimonas diazotrophica]|uniref:Uncharacterized protein n=1 Tax=Celerinatantimonas diazotrophica TaxID=412034 RepID=A0A4V6NEI5_9GAMM|nr:hypothetical protein [Celerinatantimonas diazotrophica]TCK63291.1 hypothetical protein EV690_0176 [Celerinatantimonas diazotrophica]CAG9298435.1 hypothetical protein CEDIAZO_03640 [Celerinatantimonas diazotrophica]